MYKRTLNIFLPVTFFFAVTYNVETPAGHFHQTLMVPLYDSLMNDLERYDAEVIDTRDRTKSVSWQSYKKYYRSKLKECDQPSCFREVFDNLANGFVNLHSNLRFASAADPPMPDSVYLMEPAVVFQYPAVRLFTDSTYIPITHINDVPTGTAIDHFMNYECPYTTRAGCASLFVKKLNRNSIKINGTAVDKFTYEDGTVVKTRIRKVKRKSAEDPKRQFATSLKGWKTIAMGSKFILLKQEGTFLLKFVDFNYGETEHDLYCTHPAPENTLCHDIQLVTKSLQQEVQVRNLVIDLQDNYGGSEISALVAAFAKRPFYDLSIRFKKTAALENDTIRRHLFWFNPRLETWFSQLKETAEYKALPYYDLLPACADFCRGSYDCSRKPIRPSARLNIANLYLVTNHHCISSCDDFVWRMTASADAIVAGQAQAADATYSRITLAYFYRNGKIVKKECGVGQPVDPRDLLFTATIANSSTVTPEGAAMQGVPAGLDYEVAVMKEHNHDVQAYTLMQVLKQYNLVK